MYAAGSKEEKRAGGRLHGGTIAHLFVFYNGGVAGASDSGVRPPMGTDGFGLACALHQRGDWLGLRRCPTGPPSNVFGNRGTPPVPPGGNQGFPAPSCERQVKLSLRIAGDSLYPRRGRSPLHPAWGGTGAASAPWRVGTLPGLPTGAGVGERDGANLPQMRLREGRRLRREGVDRGGCGLLRAPQEVRQGRAWRGAVHTKPGRATFLPSLRQVAGVEGPDLDQPSVHRAVLP